MSVSSHGMQWGSGCAAYFTASSALYRLSGWKRLEKSRRFSSVVEEKRAVWKVRDDHSYSLFSALRYSCGLTSCRGVIQLNLCTERKDTS